MQPMEKLLKDEIKIIFPRIKELVDVHSNFLERLKEATEFPSKFKLYSIFLDFREQFLIYGEYCARMIEGIISNVAKIYLFINFFGSNGHIKRCLQAKCCC